MAETFLQELAGKNLDGYSIQKWWRVETPVSDDFEYYDNQETAEIAGIDPEGEDYSPDEVFVLAKEGECMGILMVYDDSELESVSLTEADVEQIKNEKIGEIKKAKLSNAQAKLLGL